jgi:GNAT superfamily N-acetyltransferase
MKNLKPIILNSDTVVIRNKNTTIGYARFNTDEMILEYLFVNPLFRRRGIGSELLFAAEKEAGDCLKPAEPISPIGKKFFRSKDVQLKAASKL